MCDGGEDSPVVLSPGTGDVFVSGDAAPGPLVFVAYDDVCV
jgi:hypothetical protein